MQEQSQEISKIQDSIRDSFPSYKDISYLGDGATSYCYRFNHERLGTRVIKTAKPSELKKKLKLREIFLDEIGILSKVHHKNVVVIHDLGNMVSQGLDVPFYTMEYLDFDLAKFMQSEHLQILKREGLISILGQAAEGLHHIHKEVSHNDIKEKNIFIDKDLNVKIGDFGFAKYFSQSLSPDSQHGTPQYWGDEQKKYMKSKSIENPDDAVIIISKKDRKPKWDIIALGFVFENLMASYIEKKPKNDLSDADRRFINQLINKMKLESCEGIQTTEELVSAIDKMRKTLVTNLVVEELSIHPRTATVRIPEVESIYASDKVKLLINHPWFQRLKDVKQLGLAYLVYPGAMHTRLEHSLGVYHKTIEYLSSLLADEHSPVLRMHIDKDKVKVLILSALLHDIGHYPFAHSFEEISKEFAHLGFTLKFIDGSIINLAPVLAELDGSYGKTFNQIINDEWGVDCRDIKAVLSRGNSPVRLEDFLRGIFCYILDSPIDVDKIDYIIRDSLHVGVPYGKYFDFSRFLQGVTIHEKKNDTIVILEKAKVPVEMLLMIRYAMYKDIYRHHAVRVAESMLNQAVYFFYKDKQEELKRERYRQELMNKLLTSSDDQILAWFYENGPIQTKELISKIKTRKIFKRLVVYRKGDAEAATIYTNIDRFRWRLSEERSEFYNFCSNLRLKLNDQFSLSMKENDIVIDVPNPDKDKIEDVFMIPEYSEGKQLSSLYAESGIFKMVMDNFQNWVHKIRIFVDEEHRNKIYGKVTISTPEGDKIDFDKINKVVKSAIDESR